LRAPGCAQPRAEPGANGCVMASIGGPRAPGSAGGAVANPARCGETGTCRNPLGGSAVPITPIPITSLDDPRIEVFRDVRDRDLRGRCGLFMAESELVLRRLLRTPQRLHSLLLSPHALENLSDALDAPGIGARVPVYVADIDLMTQIAGFHIHRGVLAAGIRPRPPEVALHAALGQLKGVERVRLIVAEGLTNVDNMGGLFRSAVAFGIEGLLLDPTCCDPLYRKAVRVSMGHVLSIPYAISDDWPADLMRLKREWDVMLIGAESIAGAAPLWRMPRAERIALLFGSERHGLSESARAACDGLYEIPMAEGVESLNVAVASAVFLYELAVGRNG
jgi:tRNA G18 (ribose-2'-O)-methylase SpoU